MFMLPKHCIKMRAVGCCLYWLRLLLRRKQTLVHTNIIPHTLEDNKLFKQCEFKPQDTSYSTQTMKWGTEKNLKWGGVTGSLTPLLQSSNASCISVKWRRCCRILICLWSSCFLFLCPMFGRMFKVLFVVSKYCLQMFIMWQINF